LRGGTAASDPGPGLLSNLRKLATQSAVYGAADVFTNVVNLLLVPLYTSFLTAVDYGNLALLILFGTLAKIVFRLGLDAGFFRIHYELKTEAERRVLAGTVSLFAAGVGALLLAAVAAAARPLTGWLFGATPVPASWVVLVAADVAAGTLAFVPLALLRIQDRPALFSTFSAARHTVNIVLKVALVMAGRGVGGILWSDLVATIVFSLALLPILFRHAALSFSRPLLAEALRFGLPKVPHGLLLQVQNLADRKILDLFVTRGEVGLYQMGYNFGQGVKFATSAFEPAWGPFVYAQLARPDARTTLARVSTHVFAFFTGAALAVAVLGGDLLTLLTPHNPAFRAAAPVIPVVALAYLLHGVFLLTSIGIGIAKKARYYPVVTGAAAAANVVANFALVPRLGMMGAAWATVLSYAVMAGLGYGISRRLVPIPFAGRRWLMAALTAAGLYGLSWLAPASLRARVPFELALVAAYASIVLATGLRRREV
jgi:O-antigen/teichoic acid export membrane protein